MYFVLIVMNSTRFIIMIIYFTETLKFQTIPNWCIDDVKFILWRYQFSIWYYHDIVTIPSQYWYSTSKRYRGNICSGWHHFDIVTITIISKKKTQNNYDINDIISLYWKDIVKTFFLKKNRFDIVTITIISGKKRDIIMISIWCHLDLDTVYWKDIVRIFAWRISN
jgi:hypothetical protein